MSRKPSPSRTPRRRSLRRERHVSIRSEQRKHLDLHKIAGAVVALAMAQAEKEAEEQRRREGEQSTQEQTGTESDRA